MGEIMEDGKTYVNKRGSGFIRTWATVVTKPWIWPRTPRSIDAATAACALATRHGSSPASPTALCAWPAMLPLVLAAPLPPSPPAARWPSAGTGTSTHGMDLSAAYRVLSLPRIISCGCIIYARVLRAGET